MFVNGFALISPIHIDEKDCQNYHIFEAKQNMKTKKVILKSSISVCGAVSVNGNPPCYAFEENLIRLVAKAMAELEKQFCDDCVSAAVSDDNVY